MIKIERRTLTSPTGLKKPLGKPNKQELYKLYWVDMLSEAQIALEYQVDPPTVVEWIVKYNIPIKGYYQTLQLAFFEVGGVSALTQVTLQHEIPFDCQTISCAVHFPAGCNALVQVYLQTSDGTKIFPYKGEYIALDGATEVFPFIYFLKSGERLQAVIANTDDTNPHSVEVIVSIQRLSVVSVG